jgi:arylsulfatase A-like enzyme
MLNRDALAWIDRTEGRPFFVFLNYYDAHDPYVPPAGAPRPFSRGDADAPRSKLELARDEYDNCLAYLDSQLETLFQQLEGRDLLEKTLVVITADHGEGFGEHDLYGHGVSLYRQELHVPLLVLLPSGASAGRRVHQPVSLRDIPATIADLAGPRQASSFPGRSLGRFWSEKGEPARRDAVLSEADQAYTLPADLQHAPIRRGPMKAVVTDGHLYIRNGDGKEELYDLAGDAPETRNRAEDVTHTPLLEQFRGTLRRLLDGAPPDAVNPNLREEELTGSDRPDTPSGTSRG